ncbi:hypothetical protein Q8A67_022363 [Cirrhinus molitorella]|uniref:Uncharacterized protein n=1 Tax=Cirrhinus molitorella TaxID=172907 RepID=A0AA88P1M1_9TELE|nr:hypothetical protein Q8A67_022363 [Cirrhinus molitorella]
MSRGCGGGLEKRGAGCRYEANGLSRRSFSPSIVGSAEDHSSRLRAFVFHQHAKKQLCRLRLQRAQCCLAVLCSGGGERGCNTINDYTLPHCQTPPTHKFVRVHAATLSLLHLTTACNSHPSRLERERSYDGVSLRKEIL